MYVLNDGTEFCARLAVPGHAQWGWVIVHVGSGAVISIPCATIQEAEQYACQKLKALGVKYTSPAPENV